MDGLIHAFQRCLESIAKKDRRAVDLLMCAGNCDRGLDLLGDPTS